ncbi:hypothetical protein RZ024_12105 [Citrobacter freundii]|jgi:hypothetical protein|uniref:Uncharacterized protein n=1 Tax=Citrobacter freundii TaxID=546 RepID=A0AAP6CPD8_CITFR|nr:MULTISPECIES: hypothetical protein [Citrobacter freundii complex]DAI78496.1 MAG TPA: hypothetical protein [Caudoviricetes sp.]EKW3668499.1 hypothetical protein [Citrobacter freundii]ELT0895287.1 hypothetical protein [Citrobacter freundii]ETX63185.1 hypothetical protein P835_02301 [Citrobacter portucalensis]MCW0941892.1 hypothetical protein [Citrobacter freundii]
MEILKFATLSRALGLQGEDILFKKKCLFDRVYNYWSRSKTLNREITFVMENDELEINIPQCDFHCFSKTKIKFIGNQPIAEIAFCIKQKDDIIKFAVFHIDSDNTMTIPSRPEAPSISIDYADNLENHFMDELVKAAVKAQLL